MGPHQHLRHRTSHQAGVSSFCLAGSPRRRRCLLKGCERRFRPSHPLSRYCSPSCQAAARRWSCWRAARQYRRTEQGRRCRREQCRRYRQRLACRKRAAADEPATCEGHHKEPSSKKSPCARPGCYVLFHPTARSPTQKFCGPLCHKALRRALVREARWRRAVARPPWEESIARPRGP